MTAEDIYYHRNLPHYHPKGNPLFITFRLAGSLPLEVLAQLKAQRQFELAALKNKTLEDRYEIEKKYFEHYEDWLDRYKDGPRWLQGENIAQIVMKEIHSMDGNSYQLMTYCIMPNHVHLLINLSLTKSLTISAVAQNIQSLTQYVYLREEPRATVISNWNAMATSGNMKVMIMLSVPKRN